MHRLRRLRRLAALLPDRRWLRTWLILPLLGGATLQAGKDESPDMAFTLFHAIRAQTSSPVIAPQALEGCLSLLYFGSSGETETAFQSRLFPDASRDQARTRVLARESTFPGYDSAGGIWLNTGISVTPDFEQAASRDWRYHVGSVPLLNNPPAAVDAINRWFARTTDQRSGNVLAREDMPPRTTACLITVTSFASGWALPYFRTDDTWPDFFYFGHGEKVRVPMMKCHRSLAYGVNEHFQILRLDYANDDLALLLLLPKQALRQREALDSLTRESFDAAVLSLEKKSVEVRLPKLNASHDSDWERPLRQLGLDHAFSDQADFSRISAPLPERIKLTRVMQQTSVRWDEKGTEARSATKAFGTALGVSAKPEPKPRFIANHPFVYVIYHQTTRKIYFMGFLADRSQLQVSQD